MLQLERDGSQRMGMVVGGTDGDDAGVAIVPNGSNAAYVTGYVNSTDFPTTQGAFQTQKGTGPQTFLMEVDSASFAGRVVRSTFFGSDGSTIPHAIAAPDAGAVYIAGSTSSTHLPGTTSLTPNPTAGFVAKFSYDLSQLTYSTLLGATITGIALRKPDPSVPEVYTTGWRFTGGQDFSNMDGFVVKLTEDTP